MERHMRDVLEDEVIYDHSQFGLLNSQDDDVSTTPVLLESKQKPRRRNWGKLLRTAALCGAYVSLGLCFSVTGPTLLFLKEQIGTSMSDISYIFTARSLGTLAGAFIGGTVLDKCNPYSAFFTTLASMGISIGAMPWFKQLWALMASSAVIGIGNGFLDTGASTLCLQLWGKDSGPYMQSLHFAFAVGGSIAPLLVEAFVETTLPNNTFSSRHVRSVTESSIFISSDINNFTVASIIQATTQAPALEMNDTAGNGTVVSNMTLTTTLPPLIRANFTTTMLNQTTLATEKPKKPKPSITNGGALGDSSQFENIPLKNEPVQFDPLPVKTSTTSQAPETTSTTKLIETTQTLNSTISVAHNINTANVNESSNVSSATPTSIAPLAGNLSTLAVNDSNCENDSKAAAAGTPVPFLQSSSTSDEGFGLTKPSSEVDEGFVNPNPSSSTATQKPLKIGSITNTKDDVSLTEKETATASVKLIEIPTTTATTTSSAPSSTTTESTTISTTTAATTSPTTAPTSTTTQDPVKMESATVQQMSTTTTTTAEPSATKSRMKNTGQQEEVSLTIPTEAPAESVPTTVSGAEIGKSPNMVVDYLERFGVTRMHMLYTVIAVIVLHSSFAFLFFLCSSAAYTASLNADRHAADRKVRPFRPRTRLVFIALMFAFYLSYVGAEVVFSQYLATFTLESHSLASTSTANYVTTTYWASFAIGRFAAIFIANFMNPTLMLYSSLGLTTLGAIILCAAAQTNVTLLYLGSAIVGFGMAPTFATGFVWTEMHLVVTHRVSSVFCIGSSIGEMFFPTVTGSLIERYPMALMYEVLGSIMLCTVVIWIAGYLANYKSKRGADSAGYHLARQNEELS